MGASHPIRKLKDKAEKREHEPNGHVRLSHQELEFMKSTTKLDEAEIKNILEKFNQMSVDGKVDRESFRRLYCQFRLESSEKLDDIADLIFRSFDSNEDGFIEFDEFLFGYAYTTKGNQEMKLEYLFALYDQDKSGFIDRNELQLVLKSMIKLLGSGKNQLKDDEIIEECMTCLDVNKNNRISKDEFIKGLLTSYAIRSLMSPFN